MDPEPSAGSEYDPRSPASFPAVALAVATRPAAFFAAMPRRGGYLRPGLFALICIVLSAVAAEAVAWEGSASAGRLVAVPAIDTVFLLAFAGVLHLIVLATLRRTRAGFEATFRVAAYGQVIQLVNWIPVVGLWIGFAWGVVLAVLGLRAVHRGERRPAGPSAADPAARGVRRPPAG